MTVPSFEGTSHESFQNSPATVFYGSFPFTKKVNQGQSSETLKQTTARTTSMLINKQTLKQNREIGVWFYKATKSSGGGGKLES